MAFHLWPSVPHLWLISFFLICSSAFAAISVEAVRENESGQTQVKSQTQRLGEQIDAIVAEFDRNGIGGEDVKTLRSIRGVLGDLSDRQMQQVIDLLQETRTAGDATAAERSADGAFDGQRNIITHLRKLLLEYQRQQQTADIAGRLDKLAERQNENLKQTVALAKQTMSRTLEQFEPAHRDMLEAIRAEQNAIKNDVAEAVARLQKLDDDADPAAKRRIDQAIAMLERENPNDSAESAMKNLQAGNVYRAAGDEKQTRDALRELAKAVTPPRPAAATLEEARRQLDKAIADQKQLAEQTRTLSHRDLHESPVAEQKQADLVDRTDQMREAIADLAPAAAGRLKAAQDKMQEARGSLNQRQREPAAQSQQSAVQNLEQARNELEARIEQAQAASPDAGEQADQSPEDAAKELAAEAEKLREDQEALAAAVMEANRPEQRDAAVAKQSAMTEKAQQLQQKAAGVSPEAAKALAEAARQMGKAEDSLTGREQNPRQAAEQQKAAAESLAQAQAKLAEIAPDPQAAMEALAKAQAAKEKIAGLLDDQKKLNASTEKTAAAKAGQTEGPKLAAEQKAIAEKTDDAQQSMPAGEAAAKAMDQARTHMRSAQRQLDQKNAQAAKPAQAKASEQLEKALAAMDQQVAKLQEQADEAEAHAAAMKSAAEAQAKAKQEAAAQANASSPKPSDKPSQKPGSPSTPQGPVDENQTRTGKGDRTDPSRNAHATGEQNQVAGSGAYIGLPQRDRTALQQSQSDKYPEEYGSMIEQYLRNLADTEKP